MFAVIKTGGKQYKVAPNDVIVVEKLSGTADETIHFEEVLMVSDDKGVQIGTPLLKGATVSALVLDQTRNKKVLIFKKQQRHTYRRKKGHRQHVTVLKIVDIKAEGSSGAPTKKAKAVEETSASN
jgi:large subunit ribosomal protein L21